MGCSMQGGRTGYDIQYLSTDVRVGHKEGWVPKKWCFSTVVPEKTLESPLGSKEMKPVNPKGNQFWIFTGGTDAEAEASILWPTDAKNQLAEKRPWCWERLKARGKRDDREWDGWMNHRLDGHEFEQALGAADGQGSLVCCSPKSQTLLSDRTELNLAYLYPSMDLGLSMYWDWFLSWWEAGIQSILAED